MENVIDINSVSYEYQFKHRVLDNISIEIKKGDFVGILGRNGVGKTTLMDLILGYRFPTKGKITILGIDVNNETGEHLKNICFMSQEITHDGFYTVEELLEFHSYFFDNYSKNLENKYSKLFNLNKKAKIGSLSTGQQKRVQIVAGLSSRAPIILIDEITAVLDPEIRHLFFETLKELNKQESKTIILATNIAEDLLSCANKIVFIDNMKAEIHSPETINKFFKLK